jgi:hypothetical protein
MSIDVMELTETERVALPAIHHRPVFLGTCTPATWICAVCWGEGWSTGWPCTPATAGGVELGRHLGLEVHW